MNSSHSDSAPIAASTPFQFLFWLAVIFAVKWPTLTEPPVWDAAFGLFPAAAELADNGFNLPALLQQPTYVEGGPNCHSESLVTLMTAIVLSVVGKGPESLALLHMLHFCTAAWTLTVLHHFVSDSIGRREAWLVCVALFACPLFRVQAGAMYFEMPLAACTISALHAYSSGRLRRAIFWSILAVLVKQSGLVVTGTLIAAILMKRDSWPKRLVLIMCLGLSSIAAITWPLIGTPVLHSVASRSVIDNWWSFMQWYHLPYLKAIPDIAIAMGLLTAGGLLMPGHVWRSLRSSPRNLTQQATIAADEESSTGANDDQYISNSAIPASRPPTAHFGLAWLLTLAFAGFFFVVPYIAKVDVYCLPRYFVSILPLIVFGLTHGLAFTLSRRSASIALLLITGWFLLNRDGTFYPPARGNNLAIIERAEDYRWLVAAQQTITRAASDLRDDSLLLYGLPEHYFLKYPWMGYAHRTPRRGRCVTLPDQRPASLKLSDLPDRFYVILDAVNLGGRDLRAVLREAEVDPSRRIRVVADVVSGPYAVGLFEVSRVEPDQKSGTLVDK